LAKSQKFSKSQIYAWPHLWMGPRTKLVGPSVQLWQKNSKNQHSVRSFAQSKNKWSWWYHKKRVKNVIGFPPITFLASERKNKVFFCNTLLLQGHPWNLLMHGPFRHIFFALTPRMQFEGLIYWQASASVHSAGSLPGGLTQSFIFGFNAFLCNVSFMCPHDLWVLMGGPLKFIDGPFHLWMAPQSITSVENFNAKTDQFYIISVTVTAQVLYSYKIKLT